MTQYQIQAQYQKHITTLQKPLYELVKDETDLRLKYLMLVIHHPVESLHDFIIKQTPSTTQLYHYNINHDIYQNFLRIVSEIIQQKCEKGINFARFKKQVNEKTIWNTMKGFWFHAAPNIITQHLWIPLLADIAQFYYQLACDWTTKQTKLDGLTLQKYLHKRFLASLLEVKCKISKHSKTSSLIQSACWKEEALQQAICTYFDDNSGYDFCGWMKQKNLRAQQIVDKYICMHAQFECKRFMRSIGINAQYVEYQVKQTALEHVILFVKKHTAHHMSMNPIQEQKAIPTTVDVTPINQNFGVHKALSAHTHSTQLPQLQSGDQFQSTNNTNDHEIGCYQCQTTNNGRNKNIYNNIHPSNTYQPRYAPRYDPYVHNTNSTNSMKYAHTDNNCAYNAEYVHHSTPQNCVHDTYYDKYANKQTEMQYKLQHNHSNGIQALRCNCALCHKQNTF